MKMKCVYHYQLFVNRALKIAESSTRMRNQELSPLMQIMSGQGGERGQGVLGRGLNYAQRKPNKQLITAFTVG